VLERRDVDAVVIGTPDQWRIPMTVEVGVRAVSAAHRENIAFRQRKVAVRKDYGL